MFFFHDMIKNVLNRQQKSSEDRPVLGLFYNFPFDAADEKIQMSL